MRRLLRGGGRLVLAQSGLLPDMFFAWDAPFEDAVARGLPSSLTRAVRARSRGHRDYLRHAIFEGAWGDKVLPYLSHDERARLRLNCDAASPEYCLDREDFHDIQTLTLCEGRSELR